MRKLITTASSLLVCLNLFGAATPANSLLNQASAFRGLSDKDLQITKAYSIAVFTGLAGLTAGSVMAAAYANGFAGLGDKDLQVVQAYAMSQGLTAIYVNPNTNSSTYGVQEALNAIPAKTGWGTNTTGALIQLGAGDFYITNSLFYSNTYISSIRISGDSILGTRLIYAGNQRTNLLRICGGGNPNGGLSLPIHVQLENLTFTSITNDLIQLVVLTNISYSRVRDCNFTGWEITTNQTHGPQLSIDGPYPTQPPNNVGLVVGNALDHGTFIEDCFFANLACGIDDYSDHMYVYGFKTAFIGQYAGPTDGTGWPNTSPYFLGPSIRIAGGLGAYIQNAHFYLVYGGIMNEGANDVTLRDVQWEGADRGLSVFNPSASTEYFHVDEFAISDDTTRYAVTHSPYAYASSPLVVPSYALYSRGMANIPGIDGQNVRATNFSIFSVRTNLMGQLAAGHTPNLNLGYEVARTNTGPIVFGPVTPSIIAGDRIFYSFAINNTGGADQPIIFPPPYITNNSPGLSGAFRCTNICYGEIRGTVGIATNVTIIQGK